MKNFIREDQLFALCGLNCGLCSMHLGGPCPGCGGGEGNQPCKIAKCSLERERIEYCNQCESFPCEEDCRRGLLSKIKPYAFTLFAKKIRGRRADGLFGKKWT